MGTRGRFLFNCVCACSLSKTFLIFMHSLWAALKSSWVRGKKHLRWARPRLKGGKWGIIHTEASAERPEQVLGGFSVRSCAAGPLVVYQGPSALIYGNSLKSLAWTPRVCPGNSVILQRELHCWASVNISQNSSAPSNPFLSQPLLMLPSLVLDWSPERSQIIWVVSSPLTRGFLCQTGINTCLLRFHMGS